MDTHNDSTMAYREIFNEIAWQKVIVGAKQLRKALTSGEVRRVYLAENADPAITEPLTQICQQKQIPITWVRSMTDLGRACGIEVGAAAAACIGNPDSNGVSP